MTQDHITMDITNAQTWIPLLGQIWKHLEAHQPYDAKTKAALYNQGKAEAFEEVVALIGAVLWGAHLQAADPADRPQAHTWFDDEQRWQQTFATQIYAAARG